MAHHHDYAVGADDADKSRRLLLATVLTSAILVAEVIGGYLSHSLALLSDAGHVFADVFSLGLSYFALRLACRLPTDTRTYGFHRAEIFAAMINGISLVVIAVIIWREAWERLFNPPEVQAGLMLVIAVIGLLVNILVLTKLSGHQHDLNLHSAYLHVLGDMLASVGVVIAAIVMATARWYLIDPIVSALLGLLIIWGAWRVISEATHILLLGVPRQLNIPEIAAAMQKVPDVLGVHSVRLWAPCSNLFIFSAHVVCCVETEAERVRVRNDLRELLAERYNVVEATLELECEPDGEQHLVRPLAHPEERHEHDHDRDHDH